VGVEIHRSTCELPHALRVNALKENAKQKHKANYKSRGHAWNPNKKMSVFEMVYLPGFCFKAKQKANSKARNQIPPQETCTSEAWVSSTPNVFPNLAC